jgi:hypothetical protein
MEKYLKRVSVADYKQWRTRVMEKAQWTEQQFSDRKTGRVRLSAAEEAVLEETTNELKAGE